MYSNMAVNNRPIKYTKSFCDYNWLFSRLDWEMVLADLGRKLTTALRSLGNSPVINEEVLERNVIWDFIRVFKQRYEIIYQNIQIRSVAWKKFVVH